MRQLESDGRHPSTRGPGTGTPVERRDYPTRPRPALGRVTGSVAASLAGKAAEMVTLVLLATVVPRVLGPADYGRFSVALTLVTVGSLALTLGGPTLMSRFVPAAAPADRLALARTLGVRLAKGRAAQLAALGVAAFVATVWDPAAFPPLVTTFVVAALALNVAATLGLQVLLGLGRTVAWSVRYPLQNSVLLVAVMVLHPQSGSTGAVAAILVAAVVGAGFAAAAVAPTFGRSRERVALPDGVIRFGALQAAGAALTQFAHRAGVLAVALLAGSTVETGHAALAIGTALGVTYAVLQAFTVSLPHLAEPADHLEELDDSSLAVEYPAGGSPSGPSVAPRRSSGRCGSWLAFPRITATLTRRDRGTADPAEAGPALGRLGTAGPVEVGRHPADVAGASRRSSRITRPPAEAGRHTADVAAAEAVLRRLAGWLLVVLVPSATGAALTLDSLVPAVFGVEFRAASAAFGPALALVVLAPVNALAVQGAALRLRPEAALASGVAAAALFLAASAVAVPAWGATGGSTAALAGACAAALVSLRLLPGAVGGRVSAASFGGAAAVLVIAAIA